MNDCDICGKHSFDSLCPEYEPKGIKHLCSEHATNIYRFECELISINAKRPSEDRFSKEHLVKAKATCLKYGLDIKVSEPKVKKEFNFVVLVNAAIVITSLSMIYLAIANYGNY